MVETGYNIKDVRSVYNLTDDSLKLINLHDSYVKGSTRRDGFTFNPGLRRSGDCLLFHPYSSQKVLVNKNNLNLIEEEDINLYFYERGYRAATTKYSEGFVRHIGGSDHVGHTWDKKTLEFGISFVIRVCNEEEYLQKSIESLQKISIPHEIIVILHNCSDKSKEIASSFKNVKIIEFNYSVSRAGFENLVTNANSKHSFVYYTNWCFSHVKFAWMFRWDADNIASPDLIEYINGKEWNDTIPTEIFVPMKMDGVCDNIEPRLFNTQTSFEKYIFWEVRKTPPKTIKISLPFFIDDQSNLKTPKGYWKRRPWFKDITEEEIIRKGYDKIEIETINKRYDNLVELVGEEPVGCARANNPVCDQYNQNVISQQDKLKELDIDLYN